LKKLRTINLVNAWYHSFQDVLSFLFILKNVEIKIYKTVVLPIVLYGWETSSVAVREKHRFRVLWRIYRPKREEAVGGWRKLHYKEHRKLYFSVNVRVIRLRRKKWGGMQQACERSDVHTKFWSKNLKGRDHLGDLGVSGKIILKWMWVWSALVSMIMNLWIL
jgi:hypothetical protein